ERKVPRRDEERRSHRALRDDHMRGALGIGAVAARDAHGLLAEPAQEFAAVDDFTTSLGERLAHLERHEERKVLLVLLHEVERAAKDFAALAGRCRSPALLRGDSRIEGTDAVLRGR